MQTIIDGDYGSRSHTRPTSPKRSIGLREIPAFLDDNGILRRTSSTTGDAYPNRGMSLDIVQTGRTVDAVTGANQNIFTFVFNQLTIDVSTLVAVDFTIGARVADTTANFYLGSWANMLFYRNAAGTTSIVQSPSVVGTAYNPATWLPTPTFYSDTASSTFRVRCAGVAGKTIDYTIRARITEIMMP
jgi:hypothetical protein